MSKHFVCQCPNIEINASDIKPPPFSRKKVDQLLVIILCCFFTELPDRILSCIRVHFFRVARFTFHQPHHPLSAMFLCFFAAIVCLFFIHILMVVFQSCFL
ncbi:hypothetical protein EGW08_016871 [Elysia chlorotica]|uniref:Uncharacterized protein n=1 Tax=Elysia chlorotica TaxID=188477 RepID=A0A433T1B7_ELYCH|nr:hypothetical protein EGW08_016871 [Elysia chlorotica]